MFGEIMKLGQPTIRPSAVKLWAVLISWFWQSQISAIFLWSIAQCYNHKKTADDHECQNHQIRTAHKLTIRRQIVGCPNLVILAILVRDGAASFESLGSLHKTRRFAILVGLAGPCIKRTKARHSGYLSRHVLLVALLGRLVLLPGHVLLLRMLLHLQAQVPPGSRERLACQAYPAQSNVHQSERLIIYYNGAPGPRQSHHRFARQGSHGRVPARRQLHSSDGQSL